jgi:hypothetical protein
MIECSLNVKLNYVTRNIVAGVLKRTKRILKRQVTIFYSECLVKICFLFLEYQMLLSLSLSLNNMEL